MLFGLVRKALSLAYLRFLLVTDLQDKITVLRNKMKLREKNLPEHIKSIFVNADLTPLEQKRIKGYGSN